MLPSSMLHHLFRGSLAILATVTAALAAPPTTPTPTPAATPSPNAAPEFAEARAWIAAKLDGIAAKHEAAPGLYVLANHDPVHLDTRMGHPMVIGGRTIAKGLYCHAPSRLLVRLAAPGRLFTAVAGLDHNDDTARGRGSVVFSVNVGGKEAFRSGVLRYGSPGVPVAVELAGAREFILEIGDAGDGIGWDQSDWGFAKVMFESGDSVYISDLVLHPSPPRLPYDAQPPFSFDYGGRPFAEFAAAWKTERTTTRLDDNRTRHIITSLDPATSLLVTCDAIEYSDFPTVEWTVRLKNGGSVDTPIISALQGIDTTFTRSGAREFTLLRAQGSTASPADFAPLSATLAPNSDTRIAPAGGRPSDSAMPYFNLQWQDEGRIVAVGWPGQWSADFARDAGGAIRITAGQELTHFVLHPGEEARTPLIAVQFTGGDTTAAQNTWRRWMIAHNLPRPGGDPMPPGHMGCSSHQFGEMIAANEANQIQFIDGYIAAGLKPDYWWMDAGWYPNNGGWWNTGTWEVDRTRFPRGLRAITDHAHGRGIKTLVWFEPERVNRSTWLYDQRPQWLLGPDSSDPGSSKLLDLGNPEARAWLTDHVDNLLKDEGIDLYRQDFNFAPLGFWRAADAPDRQGIAEMRHVEGYLAYWDELLRRHPGMPIDTCSSGGRRLDLETLRRAVPLLRSDYILEPTGQQCHTYGLSPWIPYYGTGWEEIGPYQLRSQLCGTIITCWDMRRSDLDFATARRELELWRAAVPCLMGDYYPLTPYTLATDQWIAWQFDLPCESRGIVQAFRRPQSQYESIRVRLQGLDAKAGYEIVDPDSGLARTMSGGQLADPGLLVTLPKSPSAALISYHRLK